MLVDKKYKKANIKKGADSLSPQGFSFKAAATSAMTSSASGKSLSEYTLECGIVSDPDLLRSRKDRQDLGKWLLGQGREKKDRRR